MLPKLKAEIMAHNGCMLMRGDSITVQRCEEIYKILEENGFVCSNAALGVGSFSMQFIGVSKNRKKDAAQYSKMKMESLYIKMNTLGMRRAQIRTKNRSFKGMRL